MESCQAMVCPAQAAKNHAEVRELVCLIPGIQIQLLRDQM